MINVPGSFVNIYHIFYQREKIGVLIGGWLKGLSFKSDCLSVATL